MEKRIGRFELVEPLGEGAFGRFYRGHDPATARDVTVQVIKLDPHASPEARAEALRHARSAGALSHPNVAAIFDIGSDDEVAYIVREFVEGRSLSQHVAEGAPYRPLAVVAWLDQIADALDFAHKRGVVHGSLEPTQILLTPTGRVKITGFGTSKLAAKAVHAAGAAGGSPEYMAPEKIRGEAVSPAADIYSLGAIIYELITGERPFASDSLVTTIFKVVNEPPPSVLALVPDTTSDVDEIVRHALAKAPTERFASARALVDALKTAAQTAEAMAPRTDGAPGAVETVFCDQCGSALRPGVKFCYKCGSATVTYGAEPAEAVPGEAPELAEPIPVEAVEAGEIAEIAEVVEPPAPAPPPVPRTEVVEAAVVPSFAETLPFAPADEADPAEVLSTEKAPAVDPVPMASAPVDRAAPPLAGYAASSGHGELPPPGADLGGKAKSGIFSGVVPVIIVLVLILFLFGLFGFMVAPRLLAPRRVPQPPPQQTSALATSARAAAAVTSSGAETVR